MTIELEAKMIQEGFLLSRNQPVNEAKKGLKSPKKDKNVAVRRFNKNPSKL
jgi:hypothetical protein